MRKFFFLSILLILSLTSNAQNEKLFHTLDRKTVINRLFDGVTFNHMNEALWKPNYSERINMPVSDDNLCHTVMDTVMYYSSSTAVVIFVTYAYDAGHRISCHACSPAIGLATFVKTGNNWELQQFQKCFLPNFGSYGEKGEFAVQKLGDNFFCLRLDTGIDGSQGYFAGAYTYYSLTDYDQFKEVFSFIYSDSNEGAMEEGKGYTDETTISIVPSKPFYTIGLTTKRNNTIITGKKKFVFSDDKREFQIVLVK
jgi:hypothetical protein